MTGAHRVLILCSGFGLGHYIPGLLIRDRLRDRGISADVAVFESLLSSEKIEMVEKNRSAYHQNFQVALTSAKIPTDSRRSIDPVAMDALLEDWERLDRRHFICISGHWVSVLDRYRETRPGLSIEADLLYVDVERPPSWKFLYKSRPNYAEGYREVRLYDAAEMQCRYAITTDHCSPSSWEDRRRRLVVHGGGWGMGTFQEHVPLLRSSGVALDVICYSRADATGNSEFRRNFMDDPEWRTWHTDVAGQYQYPPFGEIVGDEALFSTQVGRHGVYRLIQQAVGIVSKAGAGTLIDSWASATPLIFLEPFGPHEALNAEVWKRSGFGVSYDAWAAAGFPLSMLHELHQNLVARRADVRDYVHEYADRLGYVQ